MTLGNIGRASYGDFAGKRKLLVIPYVVAMSDDEALVEMVRTYWRDAVAQVRSLERKLGSVAHLFHEGIAAAADARQALENGNPHGHEQLVGLIESGARLEPTEDLDCLLEAMDLHRCMSVVQSSERVAERLMSWYEESRKARYGAIVSNIDRVLEQNGVGVLVVSPDHDMRFPADVEAVYVVPPVLDKINLWLRDHSVRPAPPQSESVPDEETPGWAMR
jgi:hypothetical protein